METLESALALMLSQAQTVRETEDVSLSAALGRVAAQDVLAPVQAPPFDRSPLDGYCLHSGDIAAASPESPARPVASFSITSRASKRS